MANIDLYKESLTHLPSNVLQGEICIEAHQEYIFEVENEQIVDISYSLKNEIFTRVTAEKSGYYYTQDENENPKEMLEKAYQNSLVSNVSIKEEYQDQFLRENKLKPLPEFSILKNQALSIYDKIKEKIREGDLAITLKISDNKLHVLGSNGLDCQSQFPLYVLVATISGKDHSLAMVVSSDMVFNDFNDVNLQPLIADLNERYQVQKQPLSHFESGKYPVILHHNFTYFLFATAWQLFSGLKYCQNSTPYVGKLYQKIASEKLNIVDDVQQGYLYQNDCQGALSSKVEVVKDGIYQQPLLNLATSKILNIENNGCAGRKPLLFGNIATDILITPRNISIVPGTTSFEEMIKKLDHGLVLCEHYDIFHSLDISSGEFAIPCYGYLVENGKKVGNLRGLTVSGNIVDLFNNILDVSDRTIKRPMHYLHNYGVSATDLLIKELNVSGE